MNNSMSKVEMYSNYFKKIQKELGIRALYLGNTEFENGLVIFEYCAVNSDRRDFYKTTTVEISRYTRKMKLERILYD